MASTVSPMPPNNDLNDVTHNGTYRIDENTKNAFSTSFGLSCQGDVVQSMVWSPGLCVQLAYSTNGNAMGYRAAERTPWKRFATTDYMVPSTDNTYDLGSGASRMRDIYTANSPTVSSDQRIKTAIQSIKMDMVRGFFMALNPTTYELTDNGKSPEERRTHWGFIAQEVEKALYDNGLNTLDFSGLIISPIHEEYETGEFEEIKWVDTDGKAHIIKKPITAKRIIDMRYGLRYEEFIAMSIAMIQGQERRMNAMESRLAALEAEAQ